MPCPRPRLRLRLGSIDEHSEYSLNLGAESPASNISFDDDRIPTPPPVRVFSRRTKWTAKTRRNSVDRDCGICFEYAVQPSRTLCCGNIFCLEHITDWLQGPSSDGRCPSCSAPCSLTNILSLASPTLRTKTTSQDASTMTTSAIATSPHNRSQSISTTSTTMSTSASGSRHSVTTTLSLLDSPTSIRYLPPSLEGELEPPFEDEYHSSSARHWLATALAFTHTYYPRSPSSPQSSSSPAGFAHSQDTQQGEGRGAKRVYPIINRRSSTIEVISRLTSVLGLTLLFYALLSD